MEDSAAGAPEEDSTTAPACFISDALVELVDIAPTLLELAGLSLPHGMQGAFAAPHS